MGEVHEKDSALSAAANGHVKMNGGLEKTESEVYKEENIFLFVPNLIGNACILQGVI